MTEVTFLPDPSNVVFSSVLKCCFFYWICRAPQFFFKVTTCIALTETVLLVDGWMDEYISGVNELIKEREGVERGNMVFIAISLTTT